MMHSQFGNHLVIYAIITAVTLTTTLLFFHFKTLYTGRQFIISVLEKACQLPIHYDGEAYDAKLVSLNKYVEAQGDFSDKLKVIEQDYSTMTGKSNADQFINAAIVVLLCYAFVVFCLYFRNTPLPPL